MRLTLDTNILISSLLRKNTPPYDLYQIWRSGAYELVTSHTQIEELQRVLFYPKLAKYIKSDEALTLVSGLLSSAYVAKDLPVITASPDPDDNRILATAIAGKCRYLVTGDKADLLMLEQVQSVTIITARSMLEVININP